MIKALFSRKKATQPLKEYYTQWIHTLKTNLPLLRRSLSSPHHHHLSTAVDLLHSHFQSYYSTLDAIAATTTATTDLLHPSSWRNPLELPFLFLGDLHPYLLPTLLRHLLHHRRHDDSDDTQIENFNFLNDPPEFYMCMKSPSEDLAGKVDEIERGMRLIVPSLVARARDAQGKVVDKVAMEWTKGSTAVAAAVEEVAEEMTCVFLDVNRLRRSALSEIIGALSVYQGGLFLEALAQFFVGFRDPLLLSQFSKCKLPLD